MSKLVSSLITGLGAVGSSFIKKNTDGKYEVAVMPLMLVMVVGSGAACAVQDDEPFGVCLKTTLTALKEIIYAI